MKLASRLVLAFALVALFASGVTTALIWQSQQRRVHLFLDRDLPRVIGRVPHPPGKPPRFLKQQLRLLRELRQANLRAALIALLVALAVGGWLAWRLTQPLEILTRAVRRYAEGDREARAKVDDEGELAELARAFNDLAERLQQEEELDRRRVADIAHELRTPLTILKGELEALADGVLEPAPQTLQRLVEEVDHLSLLVGDLRLLSLADSGELALTLQENDLAQLLARSAEAFEPMARQRGLRLRLELKTAPARFDNARMRQVAVNLLDNALRHAREQVVISSWSQKGSACFTVSDDGAGIAPQDLPHVFDRFYRADPARARSTGGSGLGLAIARAIVEAHGGAISVANEAEGGTRFIVCLPQNEPTRPA